MGDGRANALGCACNQRDFSLKIAHGAAPTSKCLLFDISMTIELIERREEWIHAVVKIF